MADAPSTTVDPEKLGTETPPAETPPEAPRDVRELSPNFFNRFDHGTAANEPAAPATTQATPEPPAAPAKKEEAAAKPAEPEAKPAAPPAKQAEPEAKQAPPEKPKEEQPAAPAVTPPAPKLAKGYRDHAPIIDDDAARRIAKAVAEGQKEATPKPADPLTAEQRAELETLEEMERLYPSKYTGLMGRARRFMLDLDKTRADWMKEHPGERFDPNSEDMLTVREQQGVLWDEADYYKAATSLVIRPMQEKLDAQTEKLKAMERQQELEQLVPQVKRMAFDDTRAAAKEIGGPIAKAFGENGNFDRQAWTDAVEKEPGGEIYADAISRISALSEAIHSLANGVPTNLQGQVIGFCLEQEEQILSGPEDAQIDSKGRTFVPRFEWNKMEQAEQRKHWTITPEVASARARNVILEDAKARASSEKERFLARAKAMGLTPAQAAAQESQAATDAASPTSPATRQSAPSAPAPAEDDNPKPTSPASLESIPVTTKAAPSEAGTFLNRWATGGATTRMK